MILPAIDGYGRSVILSPQYQSPQGYSQQQGLDTKSGPRSNALKGGVLLSPVYGLAVSGLPAPYNMMPEYGHQQVPLFYQGGPFWDQGFGFQYDSSDPTGWSTLALSSISSGNAPAIDCWANYPGQYPGDYPNRTPGPTFWTDPADPFHTPYTWPLWTLTAISVPHNGVGNNSSWTLPNIVSLGADRWQISVACGYVAWGLSGDMPAPNVWPDIMKPSGLTLPFRYQAGGSTWAGSTVSIVRIPKPGYPYH